jgi:hypothetical protein
MATPRALTYCPGFSLLAGTVMRGFNLRKLFSPIPRTFISSSKTFATTMGAIRTQAFPVATTRSDHHLLA